MTYFNKKEYACQCRCGLDTLDDKFLEKLNQLRQKLGTPIIINSGCRCVSHNKKVGGSSTSDHLPDAQGSCHGVDISCVTSNQRYAIIKEAVKIFNRVGIAKTFIHVGDAVTNPSGVIWIY